MLDGIRSSMLLLPPLRRDQSEHNFRWCFQAIKPSGDSDQVSEATAADDNSQGEPTGGDGGTAPAADANASNE